MDVSEIKNYIIENDKYEQILQELGCYNITYHKNHTEIRCAINSTDNATSLKIYKDTTYFSYYGERNLSNRHGDIFILVQTLQNITFPESINFVKNILGLTEKITIQQKQYPFGNYFHKIKLTNSVQQNTEIQTYQEEILKQFKNNANLEFLKDGISLETQFKFNIGYDEYSNRISIPWHTPKGEIAGVIGRWLGNDYEKYNAVKYRPIIPETDFQKSCLLYGLYENYSNMLNNSIFVFESEKSVMQLDSMGLNQGVAIGSHYMSDIQIRLIKSLFPQMIVLAFDEGIEEGYLISECKRLQYINSFAKTKIGYIIDKNREILGEKQSPTDVGVVGFTQLLNNYVKWM